MRTARLILLVLLVTACGKPLAGGPPLTSNDYKLYAAAMTSKASLIEVIDSRSRSVERSLPEGTLSTDLRHLYAVSASQLTDIDPQTGSTLGSMQLPRSYSLPVASMDGTYGGLSPSGRWLVLQSWDPGDTTWPTSSHFLLVSTAFDQRPVRVDLAGRFEFDAISNDGHRLYLIEYLTDAIYRVRFYDVAKQMLDPTIVVDKTNPSESMSGQRVMGVPSPDGQWLYSIYIREKEGPFIHALNLDNPFAFCVDLPGPGYGSNADALGWSLALGGDTLFAVDPALGVVDHLSLGSGPPQLTKTARLDSGSTTAGLVLNVEAKEMGGGSLLSRDGKTLITAGRTGLTFVDTASLRIRNYALDGSQVMGLGLSPDGQIVYAATSDRKIAEVSTASARVGATFDPGGGMPFAILAVSGPSA